MAKQSRADKLADKRINRAYLDGCKNVQVNIMDIGKIFAHGKLQIAKGVNDEELQAGIVAFVETIRQN